jgi:thymidine kinase
METELILGPMFSGKTSKLFDRLKKYLVSDRKVILISHGADNRYAIGKRQLASSHDGIIMQAVKTKVLDSVEIPEDVTVIGIDEGQFFEGLGDFCLKQNQLGRTVIVAALNHEATPQRNVWPNVVPLFGFAFITVIPAVCVLCHKPAMCTRRLSETVPVPLGQIDIGGDDKYIATCSKCYTVVPIPDQVIAKRREQVNYIKEISCSSGGGGTSN